MVRCFQAAVTISVMLFALTLATLGWAGQLLVVSNADQTLAFYDTASKKLLGTAPTGVDPREIAVSPDGRLAFVSDFGDHKNTVSVFDVRARSARNRIVIKDIWGPHGLDVSSDGKSLYATCEKSRAIVRIDIATGKVLKKYSNSMRGSHMLTLSPDDRQVYVLNYVDDNITIFDATSGAIDRHILVGDHPDGIAVSPDGKELWVTASGADDITIIDLETKRKAETLPCRTAPTRLRFTPDGERVIVACTIMGYVFVFDAAERSAVKKIATGDNPDGIAVEPNSKRAYIANTGANTVSVLDLDSLKVTDEFEVVKRPAGIAYVE